MNILFICTGNTCRSPMAQGLIETLAQERGLSIVASSAGLFAAYGAKVTPEAVEAVKDRVDISGHESRPLKVDLVNAADLVLAMADDHKTVLLRQFPFDADKIKTLAEWAGEEGDVTDPHGGSQEVYNHCAKTIEDLLEKGLEAMADS